jgi:hypothetical protein
MLKIKLKFFHFAPIRVLKGINTMFGILNRMGTIRINAHGDNIRLPNFSSVKLESNCRRSENFQMKKSNFNAIDIIDAAADADATVGLLS